jgi:transcriptional regulator with XRE-family HTH domain
MKLTLEQAAEITGVDAKHLQQIESGAVNVTLATLLRIGDGFGASLAKLLGGALPMREPNPVRQPAGRTTPQVGIAGHMIRSGEELAEDVGATVKRLRRALDMTQRELSLRVGVSVKYVQRVEAGGENLTLASLAKIAAGLGVDASALLRESSPSADRADNARARRRSPTSSDRR